MAAPNAPNPGLLGRLSKVFLGDRSPTGRDGSRRLGDTSWTSPEGREGAVLNYLHQFGHTRAARYKDYRDMDEFSTVVSSALDIYADHAVGGIAADDNEELSEFQIEYGPKATRAQKKIAEDTEERLALHDNLWSVARELSLIGDVFDEMVISSDRLIVRIQPLSPDSMTRFSSPKQAKQGGQDIEALFVQHPDRIPGGDLHGSQPVYFEDWQVVHARNQMDRRSLYGRSVLHSARRLYRQIEMMLDGMVIGRINRSHMRYLWKIPVPGATTYAQGLEYIQTIEKQQTTRRTLDPSTGKLKFENKHLLPEGDIRIPVYSDSPNSSGVEVLQGQGNLAQIKDVEFFMGLMFAALKTPKSLMGFEESAHNRSVVETLDVRFARSVRRLELSIVTYLRRIYDTAFMLQGYGLGEVDYKVVMPKLRVEDMTAAAELRNLRATFAKTVVADMGVRLTDDFILKYLVGLTDEEMENVKFKKPQKAAPPSPFGSFGAPGMFASTEDRGPVLSEADTARILREAESNPAIQETLQNLSWLVAMRLERQGIRSFSARSGFDENAYLEHRIHGDIIAESLAAAGPSRNGHR